MEELDATDEIDSDLQTTRRDFRRLEQVYYKVIRPMRKLYIRERVDWQESFRGGADAGKQSTAQAGFNSGYRSGIEDGTKRGHILGELK